MIFGNDNRSSLVLTVLAISFVFIATLGRVLDVDVRSWAVIGFSIVGAAAALGIAFSRR